MLILLFIILTIIPCILYREEIKEKINSLVCKEYNMERVRLDEEYDMEGTRHNEEQTLDEYNAELDERIELRLEVESNRSDTTSDISDIDERKNFYLHCS